MTELNDDQRAIAEECDAGKSKPAAAPGVYQLSPQARLQLQHEEHEVGSPHPLLVALGEAPAPTSKAAAGAGEDDIMCGQCGRWMCVHTDTFVTELQEKLRAAESRADECGELLGLIVVAGTLKPYETLTSWPDHAAASAVKRILDERDRWYSYATDEQTLRKAAEARAETLAAELVRANVVIRTFMNDEVNTQEIRDRVLATESRAEKAEATLVTDREFRLEEAVRLLQRAQAAESDAAEWKRRAKHAYPVNQSRREQEAVERADRLEGELREMRLYIERLVNLAKSPGGGNVVWPADLERLLKESP